MKLNKGFALENLGRYSEALDAYYKLIKSINLFYLGMQLSYSIKSKLRLMHGIIKAGALYNLGRYSEALEAYN